MSFWAWKDSLSEVVKYHDVCIHVEKVVAVGGVVVRGPLLRFGAPVWEHVITVFGLIVHAVEAGHLHQQEGTRWLVVHIKPALKTNLLTYLRKTCSSLWFCGSTVAANKGRNMFSSILAKLGTSFFDLKISLKHKQFVSDHEGNYYCSVAHFLVCLALTIFWGLESSSSCLESTFCGGWTTWRDCPTLLDKNRRWKASALRAGTYSPPDRGPLPVEKTESKCSHPSRHSSLHKLPHLYDAGEIVSADEVVGFQEDFSEFAGPDRVVFWIELVKAVEGVSPLSTQSRTDHTKRKQTGQCYGTKHSSAFSLTACTSRESTVRS